MAVNSRQFPANLTFGLARSTQPHLLPARFDGYPARLLNSPEQSSPLAGSSFKRGLGASGLFGFP